MKKRMIALVAVFAMAVGMLGGCGNNNSADAGKDNAVSAAGETSAAEEDSDQAKADEVAALIDAIYVQERTDKTDEQCEAAKAAWDKLTDAQKELVEGENAGVEKAIQAANPDWSVRRAFTAQIIINHVQARDGEKIDNVDQALQRAIDNGVKNLVVQPTHLMHGAEYDELVEALDNYKDKFESVTVAEPLLGEVGADATVVNEDKAKVAEDITAEAVKDAGYDSLEAVKADSTAFVFMGHGTSHTAKVSYSQMASQMAALGYDNVFVGTVEGEPEETACEAVIMAGDDDDSWKSMFTASGNFDKVDTQIAGLGEIEAVQQIYVDHTKAAIDSLGK